MTYNITDIQQFNKIINNRSMNGNILLETTVGIYPFITQSEFIELLRHVQTVIKLSQTINEYNIPDLNITVGEIALSIAQFRLRTNANEYITASVSNTKLSISTFRGDITCTGVSAGQCIITLTAPENATHNALLITYNINITEAIIVFL